MKMLSGNLSRKPKITWYTVLFILHIVLLQNTGCERKDIRSIVAMWMERPLKFNKSPSSNFTAILKNSKYNDMDNALIDIIESCLMPNETRSLLLAGEFDNFLRSHRKYFESRKVALVADSDNSAFDSFVLTKYSVRDHPIYNVARMLHKLHYFVVFASSLPILQLTMRRAAESIWENPEGFYILYAMDRYGCGEAFGFLWTAWEFDHTNVLYLCRDRAGHIAAYTFNPFSSIAPSPWKEVKRYKGRDGHPWTLLTRKYQSGKSMCNNLYFDKTSTVDGYKVRANAMAMEPFLIIDGNGTKLKNFHGENGKTIKNLWRRLKVTPVINVFDASNVDLFTTNDSTKTLTGPFTDVMNSKADMTMNKGFLLPRMALRYTYPHAQGGICVVTRNSGFESELTKLLDFLSTELVACIVLINLLTILVLAWTGRQGLLAATLNALRAFVCVSVVPPPQTTYGRIYLHTVMFTFVTINAIFQSHWSSILTLPVPIANIENMDDLRKSEYTIYSTRIMRDIIGDNELRDRVHIIAYKQCKTTLLNYVNAACLIDCRHGLHRIPENLFHHSQTIQEFPEAYVTRPNWPLYSRVSRMIQNMVETGMISRWRWKDLRSYRQYYRNQQLRTSAGYRVLEIKRLEFIFYFLIAGLFCATIVFFIELIVGQRKRVFKTTKELRGVQSKTTTRFSSKIQRKQDTLSWTP